MHLVTNLNLSALGNIVTRIIFSIALLGLVFVMSGFFAGEPSSYAGSDSILAIQQQTSAISVSSSECLCDIPSNSPTVTLLLIAALAASLIMGTFIYGSHFMYLLTTHPKTL
jgi:hypothetical protein